MIFIRVKIKDSISVDEVVITITEKIEFISYKDGYYKQSETLEKNEDNIRTLVAFLNYQSIKNIKCWVDGDKIDYRKVVNF